MGSLVDFLPTDHPLVGVGRVMMKMLVLNIQLLLWMGNLRLVLLMR